MSENKQEIIVMCGLPGSGKSKWAEIYSKAYPEYTVVSTDTIRKEKFGDESDQSNNWLVFVTAYSKILEIIKEGGCAIFDATNLRKKDRKKIVKFFSDKGVNLKLVWMATPIEICKLRNKQRTRVVPEEVIDRMLLSFTEPTLDEGWNEIVFNKIILYSRED